MTLEDEAPVERVCVRIRADRLRSSFSADHKNSRSEAIINFCLDCVGYESGYRKDIAECTSYECFLWPFRPYATKNQLVRPTGTVPTREEYEGMIKVNSSPERIAQGKRLGAMRKNKC